MKGKRVMAAALTAALSLGSAMGSMAAGWEAVGTSDWKYLNDNGTYAASAWVEHTDGHWYYLKADTLMAKGWVLDPTDNHWYFTDSTGALVSGLIEVNNNVYYMNETHDGSFGALFVGQKTYNGVTYTFTENGTTNGKPYTSRKYNSDGTAIAVTTTRTSSSYSGGHFVPSAPSTEEKMEDVKKEIESLAEGNAAVKEINVSEPTADNTNNVTVKMDKTIDGKNIDEAKDAVKEAAESIINSAEIETEQPITVKIGNHSKSCTTVEDAKEKLDEFLKTWVTSANYAQYKGAIITVYMNGEKVTYDISVLAS